MTTTPPRTCTMSDDWDVITKREPGTLTACGEPALAILTQACVHEHVDRALLCMGCAAEVQQITGDMICRRCEEAGHECHVTVKIEWAEG